tara:strand:+ start:3008 stop:5278 length:2271 start_codon:yes stop_codon:yes gene_type:complete
MKIQNAQGHIVEVPRHLRNKVKKMIASNQHDEVSRMFANGGVIDNTTYGKQAVNRFTFGGETESLVNQYNGEEQYNFGGTLGSIFGTLAPMVGMIPGVGTIAGAAIGAAGAGISQLANGKKFNPGEILMSGASGALGAVGAKGAKAMSALGKTALTTATTPLAGQAVNSVFGVDSQEAQSQDMSPQSIPPQRGYAGTPTNNYTNQGYATGGRMINEGNGIEHAYGPSHEQGGIQYDGQSEIEGGEKVLDGNYVLTDQPNSNLDKTQMSISRRFDKDHKAISDRNPNKISDKAKEYLKQDAMQKNEVYLQARHQKMMDKIGKIAKKYGYGGNLESLSAELGVYAPGGSIWDLPMNQRQQTTTFDPSQVPVYLDRYKAALQNVPVNNNNRSQSGNSQYQNLYPRYQDALHQADQTSMNRPLYHTPDAPQQYDTPDYDTRPNDLGNRRLSANTPNRVRGNRQVQKPHALADVPDYMNPVSNVRVNNQRVIPATPYSGIPNQSATDPANNINTQPWNPYNRPGDPWNEANKLTYPGGKSQGGQPDPNSPYVQHGNQTPWSMDKQSQPVQGQGANFGRIAETIGTYAPGIYNLARGIFDKTDQMNASDYMIPQQSPYLIPTQTGEGEIRDAYTRGLYDMRGSGTYSKLGQVNLTNQRAKNNYERKLQIMGANAGIRNQTASQNSNINAQNAQMKQGVYDWNARSRAQKGNFVGQGISDLSTGIQNERNYRNDLTGIDMAFNNPTTRNYLASIGYRRKRQNQ